MSRSFFQLTLIHFKEYLREPGILFWTLAFPTAMAWILGIAFSSSATLEKKIALVGPAGKLEAVSSLTILSVGPQEARRMLRQGRVVLILEKVESGWQAIFDPATAEAELAYYRLKEALERENGADSTQEEVGPAGENPDPPVLLPVHITEKGNRYVDFLVPGLLALGIMNSCLWGTGWALIELRIKKLLRRMVASPMRRGEFLLSFFVARLALSLAEAAILFGFSYAYFGFSVQGSWWGALALFVSGNLAFWAAGVLLSCRAESARTANGLINFVTLPMTIVGGIFFSHHNFPEWASAFIQYLPLTMLAEGLRTVANEGASLLAVLPATAVLLGVTIVCFSLGLRFYRWY